MYAVAFAFLMLVACRSAQGYGGLNGSGSKYRLDYSAEVYVNYNEGVIRDMTGRHALVSPGAYNGCSNSRDVSGCVGNHDNTSNATWRTTVDFDLPTNTDLTVHMSYSQRTADVSWETKLMSFARLSGADYSGIITFGFYGAIGALGATTNCPRIYIGDGATTVDNYNAAYHPQYLTWVNFAMTHVNTGAAVGTTTGYWNLGQYLSAASQPCVFGNIAKTFGVAGDWTVGMATYSVVYIPDGLTDNVLLARRAFTAAEVCRFEMFSSENKYR